MQLIKLIHTSKFKIIGQQTGSLLSGRKKNNDIQPLYLSDAFSGLSHTGLDVF